MVKVAEYLHRAVQTAVKLQNEAGSRLLKDFVRVATEGNGEGKKEVEQLKKDVEAFAVQFPLPGIPVSATGCVGHSSSQIDQDTSVIKRPEEL